MKYRYFVSAFGFVLAAGVAALAAPAVTDGLVFYYSFDDITCGADVIINDGSGNDMDGRVVTAASPGQTSSITFVSGVSGNAARFTVSAADDLANNDYAAIEIVNCWETVGKPAPLGLDGDPYYPQPSNYAECYAYEFQDDGDEPDAADIPTDAMTFALWVKTTSSPELQATFCASAYDPDQRPSRGLGNARAAWPYHLEIRDTTFRYTIRQDGGVGPGTGNGSAYGMQTIISENPIEGQFGNDVALTHGEWTHVAWVYSQSQAVWSFYLNGEEVATGVPDGEGPIYDNWDNGALLGLTPDIARQFIGEMDEVYMFKRALSGHEVATLAAVPEPTTFVLLCAFGLLACVTRRR